MMGGKSALPLLKNIKLRIFVSFDVTNGGNFASYIRKQTNLPLNLTNHLYDANQKNGALYSRSCFGFLGLCS